MEAGKEKKEMSSDPAGFRKFVRTPSKLLVLNSASLHKDLSSEGVKNCWEAAALA